MAKTIDNLGLETSTRYAQDQKLLDEKTFKDSKAVSLQTEIDVMVPSFPSEWDTLFEVSRKNIPWADFTSPHLFAEQKKRLFTFHLIPALGSDELIDALVQRITAKVSEKKEEEKEKEREEARMSWEEEREKEEKEKEKGALLKLLRCINLLDKVLIDINARRGQFHRG